MGLRAHVWVETGGTNTVLGRVDVFSWPTTRGCVVVAAAAVVVARVVGVVTAAAPPAPGWTVLIVASVREAIGCQREVRTGCREAGNLQVTAPSRLVVRETTTCGSGSGRRRRSA